MLFIYFITLWSKLISAFFCDFMQSSIPTMDADDSEIIHELQVEQKDHSLNDLNDRGSDETANVDEG